MARKTTLVIGASDNPERISFKAVLALQKHGIPVKAIGIREGKIGNVHIVTDNEVTHDIHTVTLYLNPNLQKQYYEYILQIHPERIIFNPGTENPELEDLANKAGIKTEYACTLVMLSTGQY